MQHQAETLGGIVRTIQTLLAGGASPVIGGGMRMNLRVPPCIVGGDEVEHAEACIMPASAAAVGELLYVDDRCFDDISARNAFRIFLRAAFEPPVVGAGKVRVIWDEDRAGIVFLSKDAWLGDLTWPC